MNDSTVNFWHSRVKTEEPIIMATCNKKTNITTNSTHIYTHVSICQEKTMYRNPMNRNADVLLNVK